MNIFYIATEDYNDLVEVLDMTMNPVGQCEGFAPGGCQLSLPNSNYLTIRFTSDNAWQEEGFQLSFHLRMLA